MTTAESSPSPAASLPTGSDDGAGADDPPPPVEPRRRRRRPAPRSNPFFRFVFPLLVVIAGYVVYQQWREGTEAVLDSTDGQDVGVVDDPAAPGYVAFVAPTPTVLVVHVDDDGGLVGVTVLAQTALEEGGTAVLLSRDLLVPFDDDEALLVHIHEEGGTEAVEQAVADLLGFGFTVDPVVIEPEGLRQWLRLVEPIPYNLVDDLTTVDVDGAEQVEIEAGGREFDGTTLAAVYGWRNPGEWDANRVERQQRIWEAWLDRIGEADDLVGVTLVFPLSPFLQSLGAGTDEVVLPPVEPVSFEGAPALYLLDADDPVWTRQVAEMVPLPIAARPGQRATVRLLDGIGDRDARDRFLPIVVAAGAEITVLGNAESFDVARSTVHYHQSDNQAAAEALAETLGLPVIYDESPDQPVDVTVTIGADMEDS